MINNKHVVIYGIGQHADLAQYYFEHDINRKVIAFTIDFKINIHIKNNLPIFNLDELRDKLKDEDYDVFIAIGGIGLNSVREYYYFKLKEMGFSLTNCISNRIAIPINTNIGLNSFIDDNSIIMPFCQIGNNISTIKGFIGHHSFIGNNVSIMAAQVGGNVYINDNCFISMGVTVVSGVTIGEYSLIDSGSIVKENVPPYSVVSSIQSKKRDIDARRVKLLGESYISFNQRIIKRGL